MAQLSEEMKAPSGEVVVKDLDERTVLRDPIQQFQAWYRDSMSSAMIHPDAMALATVSPDGRPSARIVLLRKALFFTRTMRAARPVRSRAIRSPPSYSIGGNYSGRFASREVLPAYPPRNRTNISPPAPGKVRSAP